MSIQVPPPKSAPLIDTAPAELVARHLRFGWWSLLVFLSMGLVLETLHGFKVAIYLDVSNETRRLMWTLAHAHGTLLGLVHLAFAFTLKTVPDWNAKLRSAASACLCAAGILMPAGFLLGGAYIYSGDPGIGIVLVPLGGFLLLASVAMIIAGSKPRIDPLPEPFAPIATPRSKRDR